MTPRPFREDPNLYVAFGRWPLPGKNGVLEDEVVYLENPPDPHHATLVKQKHGRRYWQKLEGTDWLSQAEAAAFLRVSRMQVNRWVNSGVLRDKKVLGTSRIQVATLHRFATGRGLRLASGVFFTG